MEGIYDPNNSFPFDKMTIHSPVAISGGNYFLKFLINQNPIYVQMPKSTTKSGIIQANKKSYCDLQFTNENEDLITWMEDLENFACKYIYENREKWFESEMELSDIENYFASPLKTYRSGKFYLARVNVPQRLGKIHLNVYDENKQLIPIETLNENSQVLSVVEFQGIKCSARSFQIEMEVKQMMTIEQKDLFESCVIPSKPTPSVISSPSTEIENIESMITLEENENPISIEENELKEEVVLDDVDEHVDQNQSVEIEQVEQTLDLDDVNVQNNLVGEVREESGPGNLEEFLEDTSLGKEKDLEDFEINLDASILPEDEMIQIKERKDVFYEMYKEARKKARIAKKMALDAYLEANKIKKAYELDSDSESDEEWIEEMASTIE